MENNFDIRIEEIFIPAKNDHDSYLCEDFIFYPEGKEKHGGYLMGLIEIRATNKEESQKITRLIINTLKENYYNQINASPDSQKLNLETVFEYALQKTNSSLLEMIQIGQINLTLENLNYLVAVAKPNQSTKNIEFFFAQQGLISVYLLHKTKQNNYKVINIVDNTPATKEEKLAKNLKIFSSTLTGQIFHHDILYFCSEIFANYLPASKINKILTTNKFQTSIDYLKTLINNDKNNSYLTNCAIFIKMEEEKQPLVEQISHQSIDKLINTTENTEKYLTSSLSLNIREKIRNFSSIFKKMKKQSGQLKGLIANRNHNGLVKKIIKLPILLLRYIFQLFTGKRKINWQKPKTFLKNFFSKIKTNKRFSQKVIIGFTLTIVFFIGTILWTNHHKKTLAFESTYREQIQQIKDLINRAQVSLITRNENDSLKFIGEADLLIAKLPIKTDSQQANQSELQKQKQTLLDKLQKIEKVIPELIAEIQKDQNKIILQKIGLNNNLLIVSDEQNIFLANPQTKKINDQTIFSESKIQNIIFDDKNLIFETENKKLVKLDNGLLKELKIDWQGITPLTINVYNGNIYAADDSSLYKYSGIDGNSFGSKTKWLKDLGSANLNANNSMTFDGNLFISANNGQIFKFFTGKNQNFNASQSLPKEIKKIQTIGDVDYLYILPQNSQKIVILTKLGELVSQYDFASLNAPIIDFCVDKDNLYLISENKIYKSKN